MRASKRTFRPSVFVMTGTVLLTTWPAVASPVWFDGTSGGEQYARFSALTAAYSDFIGPGNTVVDFSSMSEGTKLGDQLKAGYGVSFLNTDGGGYDWASGVHPEGGPNVEDLTGYDGSYMPDGKMVYLKSDNNMPNAPFTILFDQPVAEVGSFWAVGQEGTVHSLTITAFDSENHLLGSRVVDAWLWDGVTDQQSYESFFALRADKPEISRVELLNNSGTDASDALVIDNVQFSQQAPEPITLAMFATGLLALRLHSRIVRR